MTERDSEAPSGAIRLLFSYEGDEVHLLSSEPVEMLAPVGDPLEGFEDQKGFWVELRQADGTLLHRQVMHAPIRRDAEVFSEDPERSIARIPVERPSGAFAVLVPDLPSADHVALVSSPLREATEAAPAAEIARFSLAEERDQQGNSE